MQRIPPKPKAGISFQEWCDEQGGPLELSRKIGKTAAQVRKWYRRDANPTLRTMQFLIKLSENRLTYESLIDSTQPIAERGDL
jgi:hypothetical protein